MGQEDRDWYRERWKQREAEEAAPVRTWLRQQWIKWTSATNRVSRGEAPPLTAAHLLIFLAAMAAGLIALSLK